MESTTSSSDSESSEESSSILTLVDFTVLPFEELGPAAAELPKKSSPAGRCSEPVEVSTSFFCFLLLVCYSPGHGGTIRSDKMDLAYSERDLAHLAAEEIEVFLVFLLVEAGPTHGEQLKG